MFKLYRSRATATVSLTPYFFYHLPKCAGMSFHTVADQTLGWVGQLANMEVPKVFRADVASQVARLPPPPYAVISSHLPFGVHRPIAPDARLVTFLRDPLGRVRSSYTYSNMRADIPSREDEFADFFHLEENRNVMTKALAGIDIQHPAEAAMLETAKENLLRYFFAFARSQRIDEFIEFFLRSSGLLNAISENVNKTSDKYMIDAAKFKDEINHLNWFDAELFEFVARNERMPTYEGGDDGSLHRLTTVFLQKTEINEVFVRSFVATTDKLNQLGALRADHTVDSEVIAALIAGVATPEWWKNGGGIIS